MPTVAGKPFAAWGAPVKAATTVKPARPPAKPARPPAKPARPHAKPGGVAGTGHSSAIVQYDLSQPGSQAFRDLSQPGKPITFVSGPEIGLFQGHGGSGVTSGGGRDNAVISSGATVAYAPGVGSVIVSPGEAGGSGGIATPAARFGTRFDPLGTDPGGGVATGGNYLTQENLDTLQAWGSNPPYGSDPAGAGGLSIGYAIYSGSVGDFIGAGAAAATTSTGLADDGSGAGS